MTRCIPPSHFRSLALAALLALTGCPDGGGGDRDASVDAPQATGTVELGQGTVQFATLAEDDPLILWSGPQGGHHFIVHARVKDLDPGDWERPSLPGNPMTTFSAFDESGQQVDLMLPPYALGYRDLGDEWLYLPSGRFLRMEEAFVPDLFGNRVRIVIRVEDASGVVATDERWIVAVPEQPPTPDAGVMDAGVDAAL